MKSHTSLSDSVDWLHLEDIEMRKNMYTAHSVMLSSWWHGPGEENGIENTYEIN